LLELPQHHVLRFRGTAQAISKACIVVAAHEKSVAPGWQALWAKVEDLAFVGPLSFDTARRNPTNPRNQWRAVSAIRAPVILGKAAYDHHICHWAKPDHKKDRQMWPDLQM
jgi:hypothetical protein